MTTSRIGLALFLIDATSRARHRAVRFERVVSAIGVGATCTAFLFACGGTPSVDDHDSSSSARGGSSNRPSGSGGSGVDIQPQGGEGGDGQDTSQPSICGNGLLETDELCDDGNTQEGDGCGTDCKSHDPTFRCETPGQLCSRWMTCGNGVIEGDEACDDGNEAEADGCSNDCSKVEPGWACPRPSRPCIKLPLCGNGKRELGEQCDDGQIPPSEGDGCDQECRLEPDYVCLVPGQPCIRVLCGDGNRTPNEACDDQNNRDGDGCSVSCEVELGYHCSPQGCSANCGDGMLRGNELDVTNCDDNNTTSGDGCSAACHIEPFFSCSDEPSLCASTIVCGDHHRDPGEVCDPPGVDGCLSDCKSFSPDIGTAPVCGNKAIEFGESCDPPNVGNGCSASCTTENGFDCPRPQYCVLKPRCGDGRVNPGEACDDGNAQVADGCSNCGVDDGWDCYGLGPSLCLQENCGDGIRTNNEQCDDRNGTPNDGCTSCRIDEGWVCPVAGESCKPRCGDGIKTGSEACDDHNLVNSDGCNSACRVEPGYSCPTAGEACTPSHCGNGIPESGESCDDNNKVAGDGCGPTCQREPTIVPGPNPVVNTTCGDGLVTGSEQCDDGNATADDGCSATCQKEPGFTCTDILNLPSSVAFRVTYRDVKSSNALTHDGHPDFQYKHLSYVAGIAGAACSTANASTCGRLDSDGKPVLKIDNRATTGIRSSDSYSLWYRDANPNNFLNDYGSPIRIMPLVRTLVLTQSTPGSDVYTFDSNGNNFYPILGTEGFGNIGAEVALCNTNTGVTNFTGSPACDACDATCMSRNYGFTTELRYYFQYGGGETLTFRGDDDVWVFINGRLAVDIGGLHSQLYGRVVLGDDGKPSGTDSNCSANGVTSLPTLGSCYTSEEQLDNLDERFGLIKGSVYEIVFFHAERHTTASNFLLTLSGFLSPRSFCTPICGDGLVVPGEVCDDGTENNKNGVSGACNTSCTMRAFCGDGEVQTGESCDNGKNTDLYVASVDGSGCAPGCVRPPYCGDGLIQPGEECDKAAANSNDGYGLDSCTKACKLGAYCGDGIPNGLELCDNASKNGIEYGSSSCGYDCNPGARCGDGVRNGPEECDDGPLGSLVCDSNCTIIPLCGDGFVSAGEACDYGIFASSNYGSCQSSCTFAPRCGDGNVDSPYEECDLGGALNQGTYNGCTEGCLFGPRCGDARVQEAEGEQCDNGYNADVYLFTQLSCGPNCKRPAFCGDGIIDSSFELCDDGSKNSDTAYEGCTTHCEYGPYCGDARRDSDAGELCDDGVGNRVYGGSASACGFDCKPAPFCGDGERNGPEQCDLGISNNNGTYGGCRDDCTWAERCGDHLVQGREQCDDGPNGSLDCTPNCESRRVLQ